MYRVYRVKIALKTQSIEVYFLPPATGQVNLAGKTAVPVDILRAGTTIVTALANGASEFATFATIDETLEFSAGRESKPVLGGERHGKLIQGFDLGNSPADYIPERVADQVVAFTTTNGTKAIEACRGSKRILIGAFVNLDAICSELANSDRVVIICAGTRNEMTLEDILFAGAVCDEVSTKCKKQVDDLAGNRQVQICHQMWVSLKSRMNAGSTTLAGSFESSQGGRDLIEIGMSSDLGLAAEVDKFQNVPELDQDRWVIK